jgi:hypothetical protein
MCSGKGYRGADSSEYAKRFVNYLMEGAEKKNRSKDLLELETKPQGICVHQNIWILRNDIRLSIHN